jgi:hypothetical protein
VSDARAWRSIAYEPWKARSASFARTAIRRSSRPVDFIRRNIDLCRAEHIGKLLINVAGVTAVPMPTLVDRFLAAEDWAHASWAGWPSRS